MRYLKLCMAVGLILAVSGTAGAITWTIDIEHSGSALSLSGSYQARTGYLDNSTWSWTMSSWDTSLSDTHADPGGSKAQIYGAFKDHPSGYLDVRARAGMDPNAGWDPAIPTNADMSYTFDFPFVSSITVGSNYLEAQLGDDWGDTYTGTGYLQIMGQHAMTPEEEASVGWYTWLWDGSQWVKHATARYVLSYDASTNTYNNSTFSWNDFDWYQGWYDIDFLLVETGLTIGTVSGLNDEITVSGADILIPEPLTMFGVFAGLAGIGGYIRRRRMA